MQRKLRPSDERVFSLMVATSHYHASLPHGLPFALYLGAVPAFKGKGFLDRRFNTLGYL